MKFVKQIFGGDVRQFGMVLALVVIVLFFTWKTNGVALEPGNVINIVQGNAYILVLAIGMVFVIIAGHIDLSVGSVAAAVGIVVAKAMSEWGLPWFAAILLGLALGVLIGAWQGIWVAYVGIPGFIVTLAGYMIFRGVNQLIGRSLTVATPPSFNTIGDGYLPEVGPNTGYNNLTVLLGLVICAVIIVGTLRTRAAQRKIGAESEPILVTAIRMGLIAAVIMIVALLMASGRKGTSLPVSGIILGALILIYSFIANKTVVGRHVYAVGGNRNAAEIAGINARNVLFSVYAFSGVLAGLSGVMLASRVISGPPNLGRGYELDAIAAVVIGGASLMGGRGTIWGTALGLLMIQTLNNGLDILVVPAYWQKVISGVLIVAAVAVDVWAVRRRSS